MTDQALSNSAHLDVCSRVGFGHYHFRNWSWDFECPTCGRKGRFSLNFLGQRTVMCDGRKFHKVHDRYGDYRKAGLSMDNVIAAMERHEQRKAIRSVA